MEKNNYYSYNLTEKVIVYGSAIAGGLAGLAATRYIGMPEYSGNILNELSMWGYSALVGLQPIAGGSAIGMGIGTLGIQSYKENKLEKNEKFKK